MRIAAVASAFPPHYYEQETLLANLSRRWAGQRNGLARLASLHRNVLVGGRHLALPLEEYERLASWGDANDAWIRCAEELGATALEAALARANLAPRQVDALFFVSVTGIATPSIDARLVNRLGLPSHVTRVPIFGLGCVAGAAGLARAADHVRAYPDQVAALVSVELCSLTVQAEDRSVANFIATGLFGDGAAAAVVCGARARGGGPRAAHAGARTGGAASQAAAAGRAAAGSPGIVASRSVFYPGTEDVMGWEISERGFKVVLSADIPDLVRTHLRQDVDRFLHDHGLARGDVAAWICHPGGPRVLEAMEDALELPGGALDATWESLSRVGNLSSASVLLVLEEFLGPRRPPAGAHGLLLAMGPGFCSELVLLRW